MNTLIFHQGKRFHFIQNNLFFFSYIRLFNRVKRLKKEKNRRRHFTSMRDEAVTDGDSVLS